MLGHLDYLFRPISEVPQQATANAGHGSHYDLVMTDCFAEIAKQFSDEEGH